MSKVVVVTDGVQGPPGPGVIVRTTAEWEANDLVLARGRVGYDEDTGTLKVGDGSTVWSALPGISGEGSGGGGGAGLPDYDAGNERDMLTVNVDRTSTDIPASGTSSDNVSITQESIVLLSGGLPPELFNFNISDGTLPFPATIDAPSLPIWLLMGQEPDPEDPMVVNLVVYTFDLEIGSRVTGVTFNADIPFMSTGGFAVIGPDGDVLNELVGNPAATPSPDDAISFAQPVVDGTNYTITGYFKEPVEIINGDEIRIAIYFLGFGVEGQVTLNSLDLHSLSAEVVVDWRSQGHITALLALGESGMNANFGDAWGVEEEVVFYCGYLSTIPMGGFVLYEHFDENGVSNPKLYRHVQPGFFEYYPLSMDDLGIIVNCIGDLRISTFQAAHMGSHRWHSNAASSWVYVSMDGVNFRLLPNGGSAMLETAMVDRSVPLRVQTYITEDLVVLSGATFSEDKSVITQESASPYTYSHGTQFLLVQLNGYDSPTFYEVAEDGLSATTSSWLSVSPSFDGLVLHVGSVVTDVPESSNFGKPGWFQIQRTGSDSDPAVLLPIKDHTFDPARFATQDDIADFITADEVPVAPTEVVAVETVMLSGGAWPVVPVDGTYDGHWFGPASLSPAHRVLVTGTNAGVYNLTESGPWEPVSLAEDALVYVAGAKAQNGGPWFSGSVWRPDGTRIDDIRNTFTLHQVLRSAIFTDTENPLVGNCPPNDYGIAHGHPTLISGAYQAGYGYGVYAGIWSTPSSENPNAPWTFIGRPSIVRYRRSPYGAVPCDYVVWGYSGGRTDWETNGIWRGFMSKGYFPDGMMYYWNGDSQLNGDYDSYDAAEHEVKSYTAVHAVVGNNEFFNAGNPTEGTIPLASFNLNANDYVLVTDGGAAGVWLTQADGTPWVWQGTPLKVVSFDQQYMRPNSNMGNVGRSMWLYAVGGNYYEASLGSQGTSAGLFEVDAVVQPFESYIDLDGMTEEEYEYAGVGLNQWILLVGSGWSGMAGIWRTPASYGQPLTQYAGSRLVDWVVNRCNSKGRVSHSAGERNQRGDVWRRTESNMFVRDFTYFRERVCVAVDAVTSTLADTDPEGGTLDPADFGVEDGDLVLFDKNYYRFGIWVAHDVGTPWEFYHNDQPSFARLKSDNSLYQNDTGVMSHADYSAGVIDGEVTNPFWKKVSDGPAPPTANPLLFDYTFTAPGSYINGVVGTTPVVDQEQILFVRFDQAFKKIRVEILGRLKGYQQPDWPDPTWSPGDVGYYSPAKQLGVHINFERNSGWEWRLADYAPTLGGYGSLPVVSDFQTDSSLYAATPTDPGFQKVVFEIEGEVVTAPGLGGFDRTWFSAQLTSESSNLPGYGTTSSYGYPATYEAETGFVQIDGVGDLVLDPDPPEGISDITISIGDYYGGVLFEEGTKIKIYGYND